MATTTQLMTADELFRLPRGRYRYELVKGELLTMSPPGAEHGLVTMNLAGRLAVYVKAHKLGFVFAAETGFKLERNPDTVLAPDIAFIRSDRISIVPRGYLEMAPDLVVEIISPGASRPRMERKTAEWFGHGAVEVWLVDPKTRTIEVRRLSVENKLLTERDVLTGDEVVSGFRIPVSEVFVQSFLESEQ